MRNFLERPLVLSVLVLLVCVWRIFSPQLPVNNGLGWDGYKYFQIVAQGLNSNSLDSYLVLRIFPSLFIHSVFGILGLIPTPENVILGFKLMSTCLLFLSALMVKDIFSRFRLSIPSQWIGFVLVFLNYGVLNNTFFYPVMTDTPAFALSVALLYFFFRGEILNLSLIGLIGAFTWPVLFPMTLALLLFPFQREVDVEPWPKKYAMAAIMAAVLYGAIMTWILLFYYNEKTDLPFSLPISEGMLPVSIIAVLLMFMAMPMVLFNASFLNHSHLVRGVNKIVLSLSLLLIVVFVLVRSVIPVASSSETLTVYHQFKIHLLYAYQRPFISLAAHFNYYGCVVLLMILFWRKFSSFISGFGFGVAGSVFFCLIFFFLKPESRALIFFFPWLTIFMSLFLGRYKFSSAFYAIIFVVNFAMAKLWLSFDYINGNILPDGTVAFPEQWFFMHLGIWMTETVWLWLCSIAIATMSLMLFTLYKFKLDKEEIFAYPKFNTQYEQ